MSTVTDGVSPGAPQAAVPPDAGWDPPPAPVLPQRTAILYRFVGLGVIAIAVLWVVLSGRSARLVLDYPSSLTPFPFTIQNFEHLAFFLALGEIYLRRKTTAYEESFLTQGYLPEDDETVLQAQDLGPIRRRVAGFGSSGDRAFLPGLIDLSILQFQASRSVDQTVTVLNSSLELLAHKVDLRYQLLRYLAWFIPTLGFLGTVMGIGSTLALVPEDGKPDMFLLSQNLTVAFDTTIVALVESAIIVYLMNMVQAREERCVSQAGAYCLRNLINRLYVGAA